MPFVMLKQAKIYKETYYKYVCSIQSGNIVIDKYLYTTATDQASYISKVSKRIFDYDVNGGYATLLDSIQVERKILSGEEGYIVFRITEKYCQDSIYSTENSANTTFLIYYAPFEGNPVTIFV